jgi:hypothetical protein
MNIVPNRKHTNALQSHDRPALSLWAFLSVLLSNLSTLGAFDWSFDACLSWSLMLEPILCARLVKP